jgi:protein-S-isoprenylcysteine O-methyltransferase Ste14
MNRYLFLIPLLTGFISNLASAFTTTYSEKWGTKTGTFFTIILRDVLGIPVWAYGFVMAIREPSATLYSSSLLSQLGGWFIIAAGCAIIIIALVSLKIKAAAPSTNDTLIKTGIYSRVRHPIHVGTAMEFAGLLILWPSLKVAMAVVLGFVWIILQSRFEEQDLVKRMPEYRQYMSVVPGFFPWKKPENNVKTIP